MNIFDNQIHNTGNFSGILTLCIGAEGSLTANISTLDHLINAGNNLVSIIYVKLSAMWILSKSYLKDELKECLPITVITKTFLIWQEQYCYCSAKIISIFTVLYSQGSMKVYLDCLSKNSKRNTV